MLLHTYFSLNCLRTRDRHPLPHTPRFPISKPAAWRDNETSASLQPCAAASTWSGGASETSHATGVAALPSASDRWLLHNTSARYLQLDPVRRVRLSATGQLSRHPDPNHVMQLNAAAVHNFKQDQRLKLGNSQARTFIPASRFPRALALV